MTITRKSLADTVDGYDDEIAALQQSKRETFQSYREDLAERGIDKDEVKAEIEAVKKAIKRRRLINEKSEEAVEAADALADEIFAEISPSRARRATRAREAVESITDNTTNSGADEAQNAKLSITPSRPVEQSDATSDDEATTSLAGAEGDEDRQLIQESTAARKDVQAQLRHEAGNEAPHAAPEDRIAGMGNDPEAVVPAGTQAPPVDTDPRAFIKQLRPHCLNPDACGGQGRNHCFSCSVKIKDDPAESEAA